MISRCNICRKKPAVKVNFKSTMKLLVTWPALKYPLKPTSGLGVTNLLDTKVLISGVLRLERHTRWLKAKGPFHLMPRLR